MAGHKSVLDKVPVICSVCKKPRNEHATMFPCSILPVGVSPNEMVEGKGEVKPKLEIVGHCPHCGGPIFGPRKLAAGTVPEVVYSCRCFRKQNAIENISEQK